MPISPKIILIFFLILGALFKPSSLEVNIQNYKKEDVIEAIAIVVQQMANNGIYTENQMYAAFRDKPLKISFVTGELDESIDRFCIYKSAKHLKDICLSGYFNGTNEIELIPEDKLYKSSLAHEIFHFMQKSIDGKQAKRHNPIETWEKLFGYKKPYRGTVNEALEKANL